MNSRSVSVHVLGSAAGSGGAHTCVVPSIVMILPPRRRPPSFPYADEKRDRALAERVPPAVAWLVVTVTAGTRPRVGRAASMILPQVAPGPTLTSGLDGVDGDPVELHERHDQVAVERLAVERPAARAEGDAAAVSRGRQQDLASAPARFAGSHDLGGSLEEARIAPRLAPDGRGWRHHALAVTLRSSSACPAMAT